MKTHFLYLAYFQAIVLDTYTFSFSLFLHYMLLLAGLQLHRPNIFSFDLIVDRQFVFLYNTYSKTKHQVPSIESTLVEKLLDQPPKHLESHTYLVDINVKHEFVPTFDEKYKIIWLFISFQNYPEYWLYATWDIQLW